MTPRRVVRWFARRATDGLLGAAVAIAVVATRDERTAREAARRQAITDAMSEASR